ncbi:hypothetical protein F0L68_14805 [Solihabitans fulvus]|uniref:Uncharacterized protein n=1 Tax=Solihabitans fulvus TaxID=1892852 RepID=A0A5B2XE36_9PSEU|nr:DUF6191 domain-containing protein [Solihabitans fulvus]KAA2261967.1 hypothetical protein F0L68_14805 [Solihabitans fulvus]
MAAALFEWSIPGWMVLLVVVGAYELMRDRRRKRTKPRLSGTYIDEYTAIFYGTKRVELDHRDSMSMMREEEAQGAPPRNGVDLDRGIVILRPEEFGQGRAAGR